MKRISFNLPLREYHTFTPEALAQLAEKLPGTPILWGPPGPGEPVRDVIGTVLEARVVDDYVVCDADVDAALDGKVGGYGANITGKARRMQGDRNYALCEEVRRVGVDALPPYMLPPDVRRYEP